MIFGVAVNHSLFESILTIFRVFLVGFYQFLNEERARCCLIEFTCKPCFWMLCVFMLCSDVQCVVSSKLAH